MADAYHRSGTELVEIRPELWSAKFYETLLAALPFNDSVARDYEGDLQMVGDRVHVGQVPEFAAAVDLTESAANDAAVVTVTGLDLIVNHELVQDFIITDRAKVQTIDASNALRDAAIYSILKKIQSLIITATVPNAAAPDHSIAYDVALTLALADLLEAKELLDTANVPTAGRVMITDAPQANDLFAVAQFSSADYIAAGQNPVQEGMLPSRILGFEPKMTTEANDVTYCFHPSYMQMAVQQGMSVKVYDTGVTGRRGTRVNCSVLMGNAQFDDLRVVSIS